MEGGGVYSLKQERLSTERQQSLIRLLMAAATSLLLLKFYFFDQSSPGFDGAKIELAGARANGDRHDEEFTKF